MGIGEKYNDIYAKNAEAYGDGAGSPDKVVEGILKYRSSGSAFEVGTGQGRNALFLAAHGFSVTARDLSSVGIDALRKKAQERGLSIEAEVGDIRTLSGEDYDIWVSTFVLHELAADEARAVLAHMRDHTAADGMHALSCFTSEGDFANANKNDGNFYPTAEELRTLYEGWDILEFREQTVYGLQQRPDGTPTENKAVKLIARKPH